MDQAFVSNLEGYLYMNMNNLTEHQCKGKCPEFKEEQCNHCLVPDSNYSEMPNSSDFVVGDTVVFVDDFMPDQLMTIHKVQSDGILLDGNRKFALSHMLRHATTSEIKAKKRLPPPAALLVSGLNDVEKYHQRAIAAQGEVS